MDALSLCQLLSVLIAVIFVWRRYSRESILMLGCVVFVNAILTGFVMRMNTEGVTWHQVFTRQVDGDTMATLFMSGLMNAAIIAMFVVFVGLQVGKFLSATSES